VAALATWRLTHLIAWEDGPGALIVRLRLRAGDGLIAEAMDCFLCLSVWMSLPVAVSVTRRRSDLLITWLALSGAACLLERLGDQSAN
jgi:hypothetical protein